MERRGFHYVSLVTLSVLLIVLPFNIALGLYQVAAMVGVLILIQTLFYYLSRSGTRYYSSIIVAYAIVCYASMIFTYFHNAGINGPTPILFFLIFQLLVTCTPKGRHTIWAVLHFVIGITLFAIQYLRPDWVPNIYASEADRYIDMGFSFVLTVLYVYILTLHLRDSYNKERNTATRQAIRIGRQHNELEDLNQQKDKLFSIIAHDLRSPLNSIQSYLELLANKLLEDDEREMLERELTRLTRNTSDMLGNLLSWSKSQMEGEHVRIETLAVDNTLANELEVQQAIALKKNIQLHRQLQPATVKTDADMLKLVVRNLVSNAIKFTQPGGQVSITGDRANGQYLISVRDNGLGIPESKQDEIFTLKLQSTFGTQNEKGVGLGLYLCKQYIELQGGHIGFTSEVGKGSEFHISLPLA